MATASQIAALKHALKKKFVSAANCCALRFTQDRMLAGTLYLSLVPITIRQPLLTWSLSRILVSRVEHSTDSFVDLEPLPRPRIARRTFKRFVCFPEWCAGHDPARSIKWVGIRRTKSVQSCTVCGFR